MEIARIVAPNESLLCEDRDEYIVASFDNEWYMVTLIVQRR